MGTMSWRHATQVGFMFPADCHDPSPFFSMLMCDERLAYRPLRRDENGVQIYPKDWPDPTPTRPWATGLARGWHSSQPPSPARA